MGLSVHTVICSERRWVHIIITPPAEPRASAWTNRWPPRSSVSPAVEWRRVTRACFSSSAFTWTDFCAEISLSNFFKSLSRRNTALLLLVACVEEKRSCRLGRLWKICTIDMRVLSKTKLTRVRMNPKHWAGGFGLSGGAVHSYWPKCGHSHHWQKISDISTLAPLSDISLDTDANESRLKQEEYTCPSVL